MDKIERRSNYGTIGSVIRITDLRVVSKPFWIPFLASFGTMILLYIIGYIADIDFLIFKISISYTEIALLPIADGNLVGFISERIIKLKSQ